MDVHFFISFAKFFLVLFGPPLAAKWVSRRFPSAKLGSRIVVFSWFLSILLSLVPVFLISWAGVEALGDAPIRGKAFNSSCSALVDQAADRHGLDRRLLAAVVEVESDCDPNALSDAGAKGYAQLMPVISEACGLEDAYDPAGNLDCGAWFLAHLVNKYDTRDLALAAYHAGEPAVDACDCVPGNWYYVEAVMVAYDRLATPAAGLVVSHPYGSHTWRVIGNGYHGGGEWPGRDLSAGECGVPVFAPIVGTVDKKGVDYLGNTYMVIRQGTVEVMLMHGDYTVNVGDSVTFSTRVGWDASNGFSSGCHTHLAIHISGRAVDPLPFIQE